MLDAFSISPPVVFDPHPPVTDGGAESVVTQAGEIILSHSTSRVITGTEFLSLWMPDEIAAMTVADPRLLAGCFKVLAQGSANLDSPETASLLALAVLKGLAPDRAHQIAAGTPPT